MIKSKKNSWLGWNENVLELRAENGGNRTCWEYSKPATYKLTKRGRREVRRRKSVSKEDLVNMKEKSVKKINDRYNNNWETPVGYYTENSFTRNYPGD